MSENVLVLYQDAQHKTCTKITHQKNKYVCNIWVTTTIQHEQRDQRKTSASPNEIEKKTAVNNR